MNTFSIGEAIRAGWETFKKRPWFFIGVTFGMYVVSWILSAPSESMSGFAYGIYSLLLFIVNIAIEMSLVVMALKALQGPEHITLRDLWKPSTFITYAIVKILTLVIVLFGLVLLIVPGIIAALMLMFSNYIVVDRGLGFVEAMKESRRITTGHRWQLLLLVLALLGINLLGLLALVVGLLVSVPVSLLAMAHVYRTLAQQAPPTPSPVPVPPTATA